MKLKIMSMFTGYCILIAVGVLLSIYSLFKIQYFIYQSAVFFIGLIMIVLGIRLFLDFNDKYFKPPTKVEGVE